MHVLRLQGLSQHVCMLIQLLKKLHLIAYFCIKKNLESVAHFHLLTREAFVLMFLLFGVLV
jgi:hypothetical protein